ncbi:hypothetical protein MHH96_20895 [Niallia sp. FSL K6-0212]
MTDYDLLLQLKEQYESAKDASDLKILIETFLNNFLQINDDVKNID